MKKVVAIAIAIATMMPNLAAARPTEGGLPRNLIDAALRTGTVVSPYAPGRIPNQVVSICSKNPAGELVTVTGTYKLFVPRGEFRLDRKSIKVTEGCAKNEPT